MGNTLFLLNFVFCCLLTVNRNGSLGPGQTKVVLKNSSIQISVVKKSAPASTLSSTTEDSSNLKKENSNGGASGALKSLCQSYGSDEDEDAD